MEGRGLDETRTEETLEGLADLFLTEPGRADGPGSDQTGDAADTHHDTAVVETGPLRLPPKPAAAQSILRTADAVEDDEGLVAGSIRRGEDRKDAAPRQRSQNHLVEAAFLGNLPGFGRAWLTQYAHHHARHHGPVAILHIDDQYVDVELVSTNDDPSLPPHQDGAFTRVSNARGDVLLDQLHDLSDMEPAPVKVWLIHLPVPPTRATLQIALELPRWTLLSGADDAAVVCAYRLLKQLLANDPHRARRRVGLMVMGSDSGGSRAAARKLNATAGSFLETPVGLVGSLKQMVPVGQRALGSFANRDELWPSVRAFLEAMQGQVLPLEPMDSVAREHDPTTELPDSTEPPGPSEHAEPQPVAPESSIDPEEAPGVPLSSEAEPGQPESETHTKHFVEDGNLQQHLPGSVPLEARCPHRPQIQLVLDGDGRINLLQHCEVDQNHTEALSAAIVELIEVRAWVSEHIQLLQMTQRQYRFDKTAPPNLHLFVNEPKWAVALIRHACSLLKLHLLHRVQIDDEQVWSCTDLN